jgi:hypothetical protein
MPFKFDPNSESDREYHEEHKRLIKKDESRKQVESISIDRNKVGYQFKKSNSRSRSKKPFPKFQKKSDDFSGISSDMTDTINLVNELGVDQTVMASEIQDVFGKLIEEMNGKYGFKISIDMESFSKSLEFIIEPKKKKVLELFISEAYSRARAILYMLYLNAICSLSAQLLAPEMINSQSMAYEDKFLILNQLFELMRNMNEIYTQVNIPDAELKLERLSESSDGNTKRVNRNDPGVRTFLKDLTQTVKSLNK